MKKSTFLNNTAEYSDSNKDVSVNIHGVSQGIKNNTNDILSRSLLLPEKKEIIDIVDDVFESLGGNMYKVKEQSRIVYNHFLEGTLPVVPGVTMLELYGRLYPLKGQTTANYTGILTYGDTFYIDENGLYIYGTSESSKPKGEYSETDNVKVYITKVESMDISEEDKKAYKGAILAQFEKGNYDTFAKNLSKQEIKKILPQTNELLFVDKVGINYDEKSEAKEIIGTFEIPHDYLFLSNNNSIFESLYQEIVAQMFNVTGVEKYFDLCSDGIYDRQTKKFIGNKSSVFDGEIKDIERNPIWVLRKTELVVLENVGIKKGDVLHMKSLFDGYDYKPNGETTNVNFSYILTKNNDAEPFICGKIKGGDLYYKLVQHRCKR